MFIDYIIDLGIQIIPGAVLGAILGVALGVTTNYLTRGYHTGQIGYKKLAYGHIAKLQILDENNENRKTCKDKLFAKHRCKRAMVLDIYHYLDEKNTRTTGVSMQDPSFIYKVGEIVQVRNYDCDHEEVCSSGIHYFLTEECAKYYELDPTSFVYKSYTGPCKKWDENGRLLEECHYKNGQLDGKFLKYDRNGCVCSDADYKNGQRDGAVKEYDQFGNLSRVLNYANGILDGEHKRYSNGELIIHELYVDGVLVKDYLKDTKNE